jgi:hypothetical protein
VTTTPFLKLQKPPFDSMPWDEAVNGNMDTLDAYISQFMNVPNFVGAWANSTAYVAGQNALDATNGIIYTCGVTHTSAASPALFSDDRAANPTYWSQSIAGQIPAVYAPINSPAFTGTPTAPTPATTDSTTKLATTAYVQAQAVGRNYLHNPLFSIAFRGNGPFTTNGYTADRWIAQVNTDTISWTVGIQNDAARVQIGDEEANRYLSNVFTGSAGAPAYNYMSQRIENVRRLAGKTITLSFWANAAAGTPKIGINLLQSFGTGGSPSTAVRALSPGSSVTISTVWTRYQVTIAIPSISGKTLGSNGDDYTAIELFFSSGATTNSIAGNIGVQAASISLWGMQLEVGPRATQLEKPDPRTDLANCQRFMQSLGFSATGYTPIAAFGGWGFAAPVSMRATPTIFNEVHTTATNVATGAVTAVGFTAFAVGLTSGGAGNWTFTGTFMATADL